MPRISPKFSIAVIVTYWVSSMASHLLRFSAGVRPTTVSQIAVFVSVKTLVVLGIVWPLLRANGERFADLGFARQALRHALLRGVLFAVGIFLLVNVALSSLLATSPTVKALFHDPQDAPLWVFSAIVGGGFCEELVRAFVLTRFNQVFGTRGLVLAVGVDTVDFGMGHLYQGVPGAVQAGLTGLIFALIFLHRRRVADAMVAHAGFDLLGIAGAYALYAHRT